MERHVLQAAAGLFPTQLEWCQNGHLPPLILCSALFQFSVNQARAPQDIDGFTRRGPEATEAEKRKLFWQMKLKMPTKIMPTGTKIPSLIVTWLASRVTIVGWNRVLPS